MNNFQVGDSVVESNDISHTVIGTVETVFADTLRVKWPNGFTESGKHVSRFRRVAPIRVGDVVRIKKPENINEFPYWSIGMDEKRLDGLTSVVTSINNHIEVKDGHSYSFHKSWCTLVDSYTTLGEPEKPKTDPPKFKVGDRLPIAPTEKIAVFAPTSVINKVIVAKPTLPLTTTWQDRTCDRCPEKMGLALYGTLGVSKQEWLCTSCARARLLQKQVAAHDRRLQRFLWTVSVGASLAAAATALLRWAL